MDSTGGSEKRSRPAFSCRLCPGSFCPRGTALAESHTETAAILVIQNPFVIAQWTKALQGVARWLIPPLADFLVDEKRSVSERGFIAKVYGKFAAEWPEAYARLEKELIRTSAADASAEDKVALAREQASVGLALLIVGQGDRVWPLLQLSPDATLRSYLIDRMAQAGVDAKVLIARFEQEKEPSIRRRDPVEPGRVWAGPINPRPAFEFSTSAAALVPGGA